MFAGLFALYAVITTLPGILLMWGAFWIAKWGLYAAVIGLVLMIIFEVFLGPFDAPDAPIKEDKPKEPTKKKASKKAINKWIDQQLDAGVAELLRRNPNLTKKQIDYARAKAREQLVNELRKHGEDI
ncbi:hypothetical protein [Campylobacter sp. MG1]|uniref:hypothetical protein n=1 Tax=Campylobacter sp. MG1 TaxID=2976332 RepID=UPI00226CF29A|nr:hypothetical protein [Campylobacter sp. MG1]